MNMIPAPALPGLVNLLLLPRLDAEGQVQAPGIIDLNEVSQRIGDTSARTVAARQLERWIRDGLLPDWALLPLLSLFGRLDLMGLAETEDAPGKSPREGELDGGTLSQQQRNAWQLSRIKSLLCEDVDALCARLRLADGAAGVRRPGSVWDEFANHQKRAAQPSEGRLRITPVGCSIAGATQARGSRSASRRISVHSRVAFEIQIPPMLLPSAAPVHLYLFHEVRTENSRQFVPLLPLPGLPGLRAAQLPTHEATLLHPIEPSEANCFVVPDHWGPVRRVFGVASTRPFGKAILQDAMSRWTISPSRLDLLAARLQDRDRWKAGSFEVWQSAYVVEGATPRR